MTYVDADNDITRILDVPISLVDMSSAVGRVLTWVNNQTGAYVCIRDVHGIMRAQEDPDLMQIHEQAGMVTPDGMPLVWICHWRGYKYVSRVCGPDFVDALSHASIGPQLRHYFYGGKPGVAERMATELTRRYPGLIVAGTETPPFRPLSADEDAAATQKIVDARPQIVWVGLSTPKQEYWMRDHVDRIPGATLIGVGAAFDFFAGDVRRAPVWMQSRGLEWLHRLASEPLRLWRRYLVMAPKFVVRVVASELKF